jgi:hypothetical protein
MSHTNESHVSSTRSLKKHLGGCHCGAVRFQVEVDVGEGATRCNCSICTRVGAAAKLVKPNAFELLSGENELAQYEWGYKISRRFFCKTCGIHCFARGHLPEVGGDYVSVNFNCLDDLDVSELTIVHWDGRHDNWDAGPRPTPWPVFQAGA